MLSSTDALQKTQAHVMAYGMGLYALLCALALCIRLFWTGYQSYRRLRHVPGSTSYALTRFRLAYDGWHARSVHSIQALHQQFGPIARVGPNQVSFNSLSALRTIYGAGSGFERTSFYRMFDAYGTPNMFTFASGVEHRNRKKLVSHMYSNQTLMERQSVEMVKRKVQAFLTMLKAESDSASEIFTTLHYFSFDAISEFVFGTKYGGTNALSGNTADRRLINDILDPARRRLAWFGIHFPAYTKWVTTRTGLVGKMVDGLGLLPMNKPFTYSGIRRHALQAFYQHKNAIEGGEKVAEDTTVIGRLFQVREKHRLSDMDIASECADHLLAGIDTTADSLMFLIWALSLPQHERYQNQLRKELLNSQVDEAGWLYPRHLSQLPWLTAILRESLRLYTPLPAFEERSAPVDTVIDGFTIPADTVVGMSPYCMHREESVFPEPRVFKPERWLADDGTLLPESAPQNKWFWAFSNGARMCIGMYLANAEMLMLLAALYRQYTTVARYPDTTPGITSRYEIFCDESMSKMTEHECWIDFQRLSG